MTIESSQSITDVPVRLGVRPSGALVIWEQDFSRQNARRRRQPGGHRYRTRESRRTLGQSEAERQGERLKSRAGFRHARFRTPCPIAKRR